MSTNDDNNNNDETDNVQYDPNQIIQQANESYTTNQKLEEAQMIYQSALLDWVDDATEMENSGRDVRAMKEAIATLWIEYAKLNAKVKMVCIVYYFVNHIIFCHGKGMVPCCNANVSVSNFMYSFYQNQYSTYVLFLLWTILMNI